MDRSSTLEYEVHGAGERLTQPVLYLVGARSAGRVEPVTGLFRAAVPHADLVTIPDADHTLQITKPRQVAEAIAEFLQDDSQPDLAESAGR